MMALMSKRSPRRKERKLKTSVANRPYMFRSRLRFRCRRIVIARSNTEPHRSGKRGSVLPVVADPSPGPREASELCFLFRFKNA
jgi:hypothetical protein